MKELEAQALEYLEDTKSLRIPDKHRELVKLLKRVQMDQRYACSSAAAMMLENPDPVCDAIMSVKAL